VLEGKQGQGKSEAIEILAGAENFSDQSILGVDDRKQQELTEGVWLYEIGELNGMRRADLEHVKAFASRKSDRARPAYGRYSISQPRRTIFFGSTNQGEYLQDDTGNRRFWPVSVHRIDLDGLRRDRDQLWAEASQLEAGGASHFLPERLWAIAAEEQEKRMQTDSWHELIYRYLNLPDKIKHDVSVHDVLCDNQFIQMRPDALKQSDAIKAGRILHQLKFMRYQRRESDGTRIWRYRRSSVDQE
jgi:predicted P-loop ATPase